MFFPHQAVGTASTATLSPLGFTSSWLSAEDRVLCREGLRLACSLVLLNSFIPMQVLASLSGHSLHATCPLLYVCLTPSLEQGHQFSGFSADSLEPVGTGAGAVARPAGTERSATETAALASLSSIQAPGSKLGSPSGQANA